MFLHGYLSNKESFNLQKKFFERDFNLFLPDLKGFGENTGMDYPYCLSDYLSEVREYMYKVGAKRPHVIAHSFGGRIAIKGASQDDKLFDKLVLTGAAGLKSRLTVKKFFKKTAFNVAKKFISKSKLQNFYSGDYRALSPVMKESFVKIVNEYLDDRLQFINNDTLIVFGKNDRETPIYMAKKLKKKIKNSKLIIIENAGHFCFIDSPQKFNGEVREFLLSK